MSIFSGLILSFFIIAMDVQAGEGASVVYWAAAGDDTTAIIVPDSPGEIRDGYLFTGWNTAADGSGATYLPGDTVGSLHEIEELFAQWTPETTTAPKTSIVSTVFYCSQPMVDDSDAIYYASFTDTFTETSRPNGMIVSVNKAGGSIQQYACNDLYRCDYLCGAETWLYFCSSFDNAIYRISKSLQVAPELVVQFSTSFNVYKVVGELIYIGFYPLKNQKKCIARYDMTTRILDTLDLAAVNWFDCDDQACYWTIRDTASVLQSWLYKKTFASGTTDLLYTGNFSMDHATNEEIFIVDDDQTASTSGDIVFRIIDKATGEISTLQLPKNDRFERDDAFIIIENVVYATSSSGELWKIPIDDPVDGAQRLAKWGSYDEDDFMPTLFGNSNILYWIAGSDPDVHISDLDPGVLLKTELK